MGEGVIWSEPGGQRNPPKNSERQQTKKKKTSLFTVHLSNERGVKRRVKKGEDAAGQSGARDRKLLIHGRSS